MIHISQIVAEKIQKREKKFRLFAQVIKKLHFLSPVKLETEHFATRK